MSFPRGWSSKIGSALKIGVVVVAAASDVGEIIDLPAPSTAAVAAWAEEGAGERSTAEKQGDLVNAAFDALADAVPDKLNDMVDSAFMDAETEVGQRFKFHLTPCLRIRYAKRESLLRSRSLVVAAACSLMQRSLKITELSMSPSSDFGLRDPRRTL